MKHSVNEMEALIQAQLSHEATKLALENANKEAANQLLLRILASLNTGEVSRVETSISHRNIS